MEVPNVVSREEWYQARRRQQPARLLQRVVGQLRGYVSYLKNLT